MKRLLFVPMFAFVTAAGDPSAGVNVSDIDNFNRENMATLETEWDRIGTALSLAARLLASYGFSDRTLTADTVLTPIAEVAASDTPRVGDHFNLVAIPASRLDRLPAHTQTVS